MLPLKPWAFNNLLKAMLAYRDPRSEWWINPAFGLRNQIAIVNASHTSCAVSVGWPEQHVRSWRRGWSLWPMVLRVAGIAALILLLAATYAVPPVLLSYRRG